MKDEKKQEKRRHIETYMDKLEEMGYATSYSYLHTAIVGDLLRIAERDGVTHLLISKSHFDVIKQYVMAFGNWDWDKKTYWGINLIVED